MLCLYVIRTFVNMKAKLLVLAYSRDKLPSIAAMFSPPLKADRRPLQASASYCADRSKS